MRTVFALVLVSSLCATSAIAEEDVERAKAAFREGSQHYKLGRFAEALEAYQRAYEAKPLPAFLFNIGQCHFNLAEYERAIFFYESYLRDAPDTGNHDVAEEQLVEAKRLYAEQQAKEREKLAADEAARRTELEAAEKERARAEEGRLAEERRLEEERRLAAEAEAEALAARGATAGPGPWLLWTGVGATAAVLTAAAVSGAILAITLTTPREVVPPSGSLGTVDARSGETP